jgi:dihydroorotase
MHEGFVSTVLGLPGIPAASEEVAVARDIALAELTGGRLHVTHLSTAAAVDLVRRARGRGIAVTADVTPHHLALTDEAVRGYDPNAKMKPPLRSAHDRDALRAGLADGAIDAVATDHAPHHADEKDVEFGLAPFGVVGLETAVGVVFTHLVHPGLVSLERAIAALSTAPARVLGLPLGTLAPGSAADVTLIDPEETWRVDPARFSSRSRNTAFAGAELRGAPAATIVEGRVVMWRGELFPAPRKLVPGSSVCS